MRVNPSYWPEGLWYKERRQQGLAFLGVVLAIFFQPILGSIAGAVTSMLIGVQDPQAVVYNSVPIWAHSVLNFQGSNSLSILPFGAALLWGAYLIAVERRGHNIETLLTGPVRRETVIRVKWEWASATILLANLPGALLLLIEASGHPVGWALRWYLVHAGLEWLACSTGMAVAVGVGQYLLSGLYALGILLLPPLLLQALSSTASPMYDTFSLIAEPGGAVGIMMHEGGPGWTGSLLNWTENVSLTTYLSDNYQLASKAGLLDWVFPVCLAGSLILYTLARTGFARADRDSFRRVFALRGFAWFFWGALCVTCAWFAGVIGTNSWASSVTATLLRREHWHGPAAFIYFLLFALIGAAIEWLVWKLGRWILHRFRPRWQGWGAGRTA